MRKWTVMIYMAGDNNLDSNGVADLKEMKRVGSTDEVAIIAQFDRSAESRHTKRYYIRNQDEEPSLDKDVLAKLGETNTGSKEEFVRFLEWGIGKFKAEHYLVIIWGHGSGVLDDNIVVENNPASKPQDKRRGIFRPAVSALAKDVIEPSTLDPINHCLHSELREENITFIAPDNESEDFLDNIELKDALNDALKAAGQKIDILGMDACLMSMAEIYYQVRDSVQIMVASEAQSEVEGWPYEQFLSKLTLNPDMCPEELAQIIVGEFINLYKSRDNVSATLTACRLNQTPELAALVDRLANSLIAHLNDKNVLNAVAATRRRVWADEVIETVDLYDFCDLLSQKCDNEAIVSVCAEVIRFIKESSVIISFDRHGQDVVFTHGIGIYFPKFEVSPPYNKLDFVSDPSLTGDSSAPSWGAFINECVKVMSR